MTQINVQNTALEVVDTGSGEPVVLIHGSASDHRTWQLQLHPFAEHHRVIAYSRRYHWPNAEITENADYAMAEHVADLRALLQEQSATPAHIVGHSYGGVVALTLAMESPELVRSLILAEPPVIALFVSNPPRAKELMKLLCTRPRTAVAIMKLGATGLGPAAAAAKRGDMDETMRLFGTAALGPGRYEALSEERKAQVRTNLFQAELLGSGFPAIHAEQVRALRIPTLLIEGQSSPTVFHRLSDALEELLPNVRRVHIPDASHLIQEDNAPAFNAAVLAFIAAHIGLERN